ncbi:hypothetical protein [Burkholderia sp. Bp8963]|uniref:hypothetical protein n=1 Tax=Burkholderia sp. Bp8963 TaxID=2184547 RepID=UPI000F5A114D|nr:hypothetical protein [Burkholderia sp. Bp8963]
MELSGFIAKAQYRLEREGRRSIPVADRPASEDREESCGSFGECGGDGCAGAILAVEAAEPGNVPSRLETGDSSFIGTSAGGNRAVDMPPRVGFVSSRPCARRFETYWSLPI